MPATHPFSTPLRALAVASCFALVVVACGDDDDTTTASDDAPAPADGETASADLDEYCGLVEDLATQSDIPSEEQLLKLKELRPDEIGEDTDAAVDAFIAADFDMGQVFSDPEMEARFERMDAHDAEVCGIESPEGDEEEEEELETEAAEGAQVVPVSAVDFAFEGIPDELPAGPTAFELTNDSESAHEMAIFKLGEGVVLDELLASDEEPSEEEAQEAGGTFAGPGEGGVFANVDLEPGSYAVVCFIPGPEGRPHFDLGMKNTFTVA